MARKNEGQKPRNACKCGKRHVAVNYVKNGITHYRSKCSSCAKLPKKKKPIWMTGGYTKKHLCEKCGFKALYPEQLDVYNTDNNYPNGANSNLKTVCLNCNAELRHTNMWSQGDLIADF